MQMLSSLLETALEHAPVGILVAEAPSGRLRYVNREASRLLGVDVPPGDGAAPWGQDLGGAVVALESAPLWHAVDGSVVRGATVSVRRADGRVLWVRVDATALRASCGSVNGVVLVVREQAEGCEDPSADRSGFLTALSHEVRTPLTAIVGYADMLAAELGGPLTAAQRHHVDRLKTSAWHTVSMLEQILTYTRAATGALELTTEPIDLRELIRDVVRVVRPHATARGIELVLDLPRTAACVETDGAKVQQILLNLVSNAVKFTDGSEIHIVCSDREGGVETIVSDGGPGIPADVRDRIFDLFQRDGIQRSAASGPGIGLPLSRQYARLLGGDLTLDTSVARGTTFRLRLPRVRSAD